MRRKIVHHHYRCWGKLRDEYLLHLRFERQPVHRPIEHHGGDGAFPGDGRNQGGGVPVSVGRVVQHTLTLSGSSVEPNHIGFSPCFIQKDQAARIDSGKPLAKLLAFEHYIRAALLDGI